MKKIASLLLIFLCTGLLSKFAKSQSNDSLDSLLATAISENIAARKIAIQKLRDLGPKALGKFIEKYGSELRGARFESNPNPHVLLLRATLDQICKQKDCDFSQLYWYTDLEKAKQAAYTEKKPILSLRLLGNLDEDLSCANSRFFRLILYSDPSIARLLRENYILHWESVRPAPKMTIDFGDGRKLERTITGNSIHYILDSQERLLDALPGLYSPQRFLSILEERRKDFITLQTDFHFTQKLTARLIQELEQSLNSDLQKLNLKKEDLGLPWREANLQKPPPAPVAGELAISKRMVERPLLRAMGTPPSLSPENENNWKKLVSLHFQQGDLSQASFELMRRKNPEGLKSCSSLSNCPQLEQFRSSVIEDTLKNEYRFRGKILEWAALQMGRTGNGAVILDGFNQRVYSILFLTPNSDPWLGLLDPNIFNGIERNGVR